MKGNIDFFQGRKILNRSFRVASVYDYGQKQGHSQSQVYSILCSQVHFQKAKHRTYFHEGGCIIFVTNMWDGCVRFFRKTLGVVNKYNLKVFKVRLLQIVCKFKIWVRWSAMSVPSLLFLIERCRKIGLSQMSYSIIFQSRFNKVVLINVQIAFSYSQKLNFWEIYLSR